MGRLGKATIPGTTNRYRPGLMFTLGPRQPLRRLLVIGAHSDDIEIGCGGTIIRLLHECPDLEVGWVVLSADGPRAEEAQASAEAMLSNVKQPDIVIDSFRDGFLPYAGAAVKERFEQLRQRFQPDLILT